MPHHEGWIAGLIGASYFDCPYGHGNDQALAWVAGYRLAEQVIWHV